jgi:hypothetical protein
MSLEQLASNNHTDHKNEGEISSITNFTNLILVNDKSNCKIFYIPVYLRAKLKNIINMDLEKLQAKVNLDLIVSVYYGGLTG